MLAWIRPTPDKVRKALFDIIGQDMEGLKFIDFFAGSGAVGLEAASRGAKRVVFVEREERCADCIGENITTLGIRPYEKRDTEVSVICADAFKTIKELAKNSEKFDIIFFDPPYERQLEKKPLKTLSGYDILHPNSTIIIQHDKREILPESEGRILRVREQKYGATVLTFFKSV